MKVYHLVKYHYGLKPMRYTAFCLTPALPRPRVVRKGGKEWKSLHNGPSASGARHFQSPDSAKAWLHGQSGQIIVPDNTDWSLLEGTKPYPSIS